MIPKYSIAKINIMTTSMTLSIPSVKKPPMSANPNHVTNAAIIGIIINGIIWIVFTLNNIATIMTIVVNPIILNILTLLIKAFSNECVLKYYKFTFEKSRIFLYVVLFN